MFNSHRQNKNKLERIKQKVGYKYLCSRILQDNNNSVLMIYQKALSTPLSCTASCLSLPHSFWLSLFTSVTLHLFFPFQHNLFFPSQLFLFHPLFILFSFTHFACLNLASPFHQYWNVALAKSCYSNTLTCPKAVKGWKGRTQQRSTISHFQENLT